MPPSPPRQSARSQHVSESTAIPRATRSAVPSTKPTASAATPTPSDRRLRLILAASVAALALLASILGGPVTAIVFILTAACILQGLWRGASEILGLLVGMLVAALLCRPIGRAFEGLTASLASTTGVTNRLVSVALAAILIALVVSIAASFALKRLWKSKKHAWMKWDHLLGAAVGLVEGAFLSLLVLWTPLIIEPIAKAEVSLDEQLGQSNQEGENVMAKRVASWATAVRESPVGGLALATNPTAASPMMQLLEDFIAVSRDEAAMEHFLKSEAIQRLKNLPSVGDAVRRLEADPELTALIKPAAPTPSSTPGTPPADDAAGPPITGETIRAILSSNTLLQVLDETTIVQDLAPITPDIAAALREAKAIIARRAPTTPGQPSPRNPGGG